MAKRKRKVMIMKSVQLKLLQPQLVVVLVPNTVVVQMVSQKLKVKATKIVQQKSQLQFQKLKTKNPRRKLIVLNQNLVAAQMEKPMLLEQNFKVAIAVHSLMDVVMMAELQLRGRTKKGVRLVLTHSLDVVEMKRHQHMVQEKRDVVCHHHLDVVRIMLIQREDPMQKDAIANTHHMAVVLTTIHQQQGITMKDAVVNTVKMVVVLTELLRLRVQTMKDASAVLSNLAVVRMA
jgi:hypothetical protein